MHFFKDTFDKNKATVLEEYAQDYADFQQKRQNALEELECVKCQLEDESDKRANEREERHLQQLDDMKSEVWIELMALDILRVLIRAGNVGSICELLFYSIKRSLKALKATIFLVKDYYLR